MALARAGDESHKSGLEQNLARLDFPALELEQKLDLLRAYGLIFIRLGAPEASVKSALIERFSPHYPSGEMALDRELCQMLVNIRCIYR